MNIDDVRPDSAQGTGIRVERDTGRVEPAPAPVRGPIASRHADHVEISEEGRALAGARDRFPAEELEDLDPARVEGIRDRIARGAYDAPAMIDELARRLLDSGDI
ncbi:MAG TPA: flagellar biosynthesis anti-sigma factor FlgM [Longimicrobiales bacterium]